LIEAKMGRSRDLAGSARAALFDLLAYRSAFAAVLDGQAGPYGLGVAWGAGLDPDDGDVMLTSPDRLSTALDRFLCFS
jgi:hypothetical protein